MGCSLILYKCSRPEERGSVNRRGVGVVLIAIAAFLFAARYVTAAVYGSNTSGSWDAEVFRGLYSYVGSGLTTAAIVALVAGIAYIVFGELTEGGRRRGDRSQG
jgi:hypothetical protein